jgi:pSer/pThr/pTyr-binding forkhead associated (FHA) protein
MACLIFRVDGHEVARRRLDRRLLIGRSTQCDISIRDPLLSRQHCLIDFNGSEWTVTDLKSRNGTWIDDQRIERRKLCNGDSIRLGIVRIFFNKGEVEEKRPRRSRPLWKRRRPAEPSKRSNVAPAKGGLVEVSDAGNAAGCPSPKPRPIDPAAYQRENLYPLFARIAASSFESEAILPARRLALPRPMPVQRTRTQPIGAASRSPTESHTSLLTQRPHPKKRATPSRFRTALLFVFVIAAGWWLRG